MNRVLRMTLAALALGGLAMAGGPANADNVVARWIQVGPGSSSATPTLASFGDAPLSLTNTVLARAIVSDITQGCPAMTVDHSLTVTMSPRFVGSTLAGTQVWPAVGPVPGTSGKTNRKNGYPQYFINANATATSTLPGPDGSTVPMATSNWTECEAIVPAPSTHTVATIGGIDLKLPVANPKRILVMADTGCRMNGALAANGANEQNCESGSAFPLQFLATYEATFKPDLIVLVGDWFYRDTNCTNAFTGCNTPSSAAFETWGDTFDSWNADVFVPAKNLLGAAPWVMLRGNHESCGRGARGWFALLDPKPYNFNNVKCAATAAYPAPGGTTAAPTVTYNADFEPTYIVPAGNVNFLAHDSSFANDAAVDINTAKNYDIDLTNALAAAGPNSINIFATHKPVFGLTYGTITGNNVNGGDFTEQAVFSGGTYAGSAFANGVPKTIGLFLSGHVHQLQYLVGPATYPPQLIVGVGGSLLDADMNTGAVPSGLTDVPGFSQISSGGTQYTFTVNKFDGTTATANFSHNYSHDEFGFAVLDAVTAASGAITGYMANTYKISSSKSGRCAITLGNGAGQTRNITCNF